MILTSPQGGRWDSWKEQGLNCQCVRGSWQSAGHPGGEYGTDQLRERHQRLQGCCISFIYFLYIAPVVSSHNVFVDIAKLSQGFTGLKMQFMQNNSNSFEVADLVLPWFEPLPFLPMLLFFFPHFIYLILLFAAQGLVSNLTLGPTILSKWTMYSLSVDEAVKEGLLGEVEATDRPEPAALSLPTFYQGSFIIPDGIPDLPQDTYIKLPGWRKARPSYRTLETLR